jgi:23S rRNA (adenine2030-N6)-methyltransferase
MNYRHGFHAGNFADVHKHVVLTLILRRLCEKPTPFRVIDTHAGAGLYDLAAGDAARTGEWRAGIGRIFAHRFGAEADALLAPYRDAVARLNPKSATLTRYPGSPLLCRALLRSDDRLIACELEPKAADALAANLGRGRRAKAIAIDGWTALMAYVPPPERRGLVLVDPPYERPDEFARLAEAIVRAHRKWPTGIYLAWYPVKDGAGPDQLARRLAAAGVPKLLRSELSPGAPEEPGRLAASGLIVVNPPWSLEHDLGILLPAVAAVLGREGDGEAAARLDWIAGAA